MVGGDVIAAIDDMVAAIMRLVDVICMLDKGEEGDVIFAFVGGVGGDVEPVGGVIGEQRPFQSKRHHHRTHVLQIHQPRQVCFGQFGGQFSEQMGRCGHENLIVPLCASGGDDGHALIHRLYFFDGAVQAHITPILADNFG